MKYLISAAALALSTTAMAQTAPAPATPAAPATVPAATVTESTTTTTTAPDAVEPAAAPAQTTTSTTETKTVAAAQPAADPKAVLAQQFPTYDKDGNGTLSQTEFAAWLTEMKTAQNTEKLTPDQISKWANGSFAKADKDKSKSVTVAELQNFLIPAAA
ncbi:hypothetical protein SPAN111604_01570 [Sphingomonas antarctica]|uniref:EF-hand domain-containing protein n=1 Tax=Sphingomonas antarctica TaxID=2040274 RepID=UPI0039EBE872